MDGNKQRRQEAMKKLERELARRDRAEKTKPLGVVLATLAILVVIVGGIWALTNMGGEDEDTTAQSTEPSAQPEPQPLAMARATALPETVSCEYTAEGEAAREVDLPNGENVPATGTVTVTLQTNHGAIPMQLDRGLSPCAVNSIQHLAESGYYDGTVCHRMTSGGLNVLQCGDPAGTGAGGPGYKFDDEYPTDQEGLESTVVYPEGSIAMANAGPGTNGSQFFLNYGNGMLAPSYSVLGTMTPEGLEVLKGISAKGIEGGQLDGKPAEEVKIESVTVG